jgi:TalC/MipB family fructose-6-phosphate aldolase
MPGNAVNMRPPLSIWIAGSIDEVVADAETGLIDAIVTNPTVVAKWCAGGRTLEQVVAEVIERTTLPLFVQLRGPGCDQMLRETDRLRSISDRILPKLPSTMEGLCAANELERLRVPMLITTICSIAQAAMFASAGADYLCPYFSRLNDSGGDAASLICDLASRFRQEPTETAIIPASIRSVEQAERAWLSGARGVIVFHDLFQKLLDHDVTQRSLESFERDDWPRIGSSQ